MKVLKSIKWRLQIWYGLILVVVLAGFGFTANQLEWGRQIHHVDDELHRRFDILVKTLHGLPPQRRQPPPALLENQFPDEPPPEDQNPSPPQQFQLPPHTADFFYTNDLNNFYFIIDGRGDKEIGRSSNVPPDKALFMHQFVAGRRNPDFIASPPQLIAFKNLKDGRAIIQRLPSGETILVGCDITFQLRELELTAWKLAGFGGIILFFGLAGGWWFVSRALRPVENISTAAVKISAGDLSQRINVAEAESELGQLAAVLNSTFARLETAFAQQKQFAADAAHELRTPVSVILTQTQTALAREREAASYRQTVEACQRAAQRMRKLIESLLELTRFDAGQEVLKRMRFDFAKTISDGSELVQTLAAERDVKIISKTTPLEITGDAERLTQVVTNLLTNAIQYNRPGGEVRVKLAAQNGLAVLEIADTGRGIAPEDLPRVFERFYRADPSRTGAGNTGLGLAICRAIVEAHGGTIEVASEVGAGTTFTVRLPPI